MRFPYGHYCTVDSTSSRSIFPAADACGLSVNHKMKKEKQFVCRDGGNNMVSMNNSVLPHRKIKFPQINGSIFLTSRDLSYRFIRNFLKLFYNDNKQWRKAMLNASNSLEIRKFSWYRKHWNNLPASGAWLNRFLPHHLHITTSRWQISRENGCV